MLILDSSHDHTTAKDDSRLKTSTTDQSTIHPSYNHWMYVINHLFKAAFKKPNAKCVASADHQITQTRKNNKLNNQPTKENHQPTNCYVHRADSSLQS
jgi:aspartyl/asparaginyl beta-hydroxylase (cupin superfamily)